MFLGPILALAGLAPLLWARSEFRRSRQLANWRAVQGRVTGITVAPAGPVKIRYEYTVEGVRHESAGTCAARLARQYPEGGPVLVWCNPRSPGEAALRRKPGEWPAVAAVCGALLLLFGLAPVRIGMLLAGLLLMAAARRMLKAGAARRNWPTREGRIERSELQKRDGREEASVVYSYSVDGIDLLGSAVTAGASPEAGSASQIVARYPAESPVCVCYDPGDPSIAILEPDGFPFQAWGTAVVGGVLVALALMGMLGL